MHALINEAGRLGHLGQFGQHAPGSTRRTGRVVPGGLQSHPLTPVHTCSHLFKAKECFTTGAVSGAVSGAGVLAVARTKSSSSLAEAEGAPATAPADAWTVHDGEQLLLDLRSGLQREVIASLIASLIASCLTSARACNAR